MKTLFFICTRFYADEVNMCLNKHTIVALFSFFYFLLLVVLCYELMRNIKSCNNYLQVQHNVSVLVLIAETIFCDKSEWSWWKGVFLIMLLLVNIYFCQETTHNCSSYQKLKQKTNKEQNKLVFIWPRVNEANQQTNITV